VPAHPPLGTSLYRRQTYPHLLANPRACPQAPIDVTGETIEVPASTSTHLDNRYEIPLPGQHRTAPIVGSLRMPDCRVVPKLSLLRCSER
jgi:hypothetical protein